MNTIKLGESTADVIGIKNRDDTVAIEVKPSNVDEIRKGLGQAQTYLDYVHKAGSVGFVEELLRFKIIQKFS